MEIPLLIAETLQNPKFENGLPLLSAEARHLLGLSEEDRENPRVLALIAMQDPIYSARLMSSANSAAYANLPLTTSVEAAIRRLGVTSSYGVLLACAMASSLAAHPNVLAHRDFLLQLNMSLPLTARRLANWLQVSEDQRAVLWLSALMYGLGLFVGLVQEGEIVEKFNKGLQCLESNHSFSVDQCPELAGFLHLSICLARKWQMTETVVQALADTASSTTPPNEQTLLLRAAVEALSLKLQDKDEAPALAHLFDNGFKEAKVPEGTRIALAILL